jgi:glycosyltransferase involved in cell wall biosynthesis
VAQHAAAPATPIEQCAELLDRRAGVCKKAPDQVRVATAAAEEELGICVERSDLRPQLRRRQGQAVVGRRRGRSPCGEDELVGTDSRSGDPKSVHEVEGAPSCAPAGRLTHWVTVTVAAERSRIVGRVSEPGARPLLTVVVPVYNGGDEIVDNVGVIRRALVEGLPGESIEIIVVSDGSIDATAEQLLAARAEAGWRVIHYDRNLGKGYAVKAGALASRGDWVALIDADLDLDPSSVPSYLAVARREDLDFAIGSKRHPESVVEYPPSRRIASWWYQQLNRALFRLDVRDTQVGLKVFHRRVVDEVVPLLLVKQFAFDLELLAVSTALGFDRIKELPIRLEYRFSGSSLGSSTVLRALWDTFAVFYRLRVLKTYQRKRGLVGAVRAAGEPPLVSIVGDDGAARNLDYPRLERATSPAHARGDLLAVLDTDARPSGNWVSAAVAFFADGDVAAVVTPTVAPLRGPLRERVAAAVVESHLGGGSRRSTAFPGNLRTVDDYAPGSFVVRRADYVAALAAGIDADELVAWLASRGRRVVYTPDASVATRQPPLVRSHVAATFRHGRRRGRLGILTRGRSLSGATAFAFAPAGAALLGVILLATGATTAGLVLVLVYAAALVASGIRAAIRFRSLALGLLEPPAVVLSQAAYLAGFVRGLLG